MKMQEHVTVWSLLLCDKRCSSALVNFILGRHVQFLVFLQRRLVTVFPVAVCAAIQLLFGVDQLVSLEVSGPAEALIAVRAGVQFLSGVC